MLAVLIAFVVAIGLVRYGQVKAAMAGAAAFRPPPEAVTTAVAREDLWDQSIAAVGSLSAVHGVVVSADMPGIVSRIAFESGRHVEAGGVLVTLDTKQEQAQLRAAEAERELARVSLERMRGLRAKGVTSQAELDDAVAAFDAADARTGEVRAAIARKTIRAPFSGVLGIRQVNLGQYLESGAPVVPLQSLDPIYADFSVPQQEASRVRVGTQVIVRFDAPDGGRAHGTVTAIDSIVDEATRNVRIQATLPNPDGALRPGMYVETDTLVGTAKPIVSVPASSINYAPYGDSVFVLEDVTGPDGQAYRGVRQQFVRLGTSRGDQVAVLSGVTPGAEVVTSGGFKLRNGAAVQVNNDVQPSDDPTPRPGES